MAQKFDLPKTETELRNTLDKIYETSKTAYENNERPSFTDLIELMSARTTIVTAIHKIKSNKGSETPGVDGKTMQKDYLEKPFEWVIKDIQSAFKYFKPQKIRRKYIDKPGKTEKRPLGIPTIRDRIVQECIKNILEPILEAQFYKYSFGFRPMRDTQMALEHVKQCVHNTGYHWIVEGDISKCFDKINHGILTKRLYHIGIKDTRLLQIIKAMLKAGIAGECEINEDGTPQGGVLSPLLANAFLDIFDEWVSTQWDDKTTRHDYSRHNDKIKWLRKRSNLIPAYLVRYADDFVIITDSREHAEWWKQHIRKFLAERMKLTLSEEKTLITDVRKQYIHFLGYEYKVVKGKAKKGYISRTIPDRKRLKRKVLLLNDEIKAFPKDWSRERVIQAINLINSKIRGVINYYSNCTWVNIAMKKYSRILQLTAARRLKSYKRKQRRKRGGSKEKRGFKWVPANQVQNLVNIHQGYTTKIPAIKYRDIWIGVTSLTFCKWEITLMKTQEETPYTESGRQLYFNRTKKKRRNARLDNMLNEKTSELIAAGLTHKNYNFEYYMNRAYALNRDKLKCRICGKWLYHGTVYSHRINPNLPIDKVNKVANLASMDCDCYNIVNNLKKSTDHLEAKVRRKVQEFRDKLVNSNKIKTHAKTNV